MAGEQQVTTYKKRTLKENMVDYLRRHSQGLSQQQFVNAIVREFGGKRNYIQKIIRDNRQLQEPLQVYVYRDM